MIVKCPIHNVRYERFDSDKYATEDCPRCLSDRKHNSEFTYEEGVRSGNRLLGLFAVFLITLTLCMVFVSALETKGGVYNGGFEYGTGTISTTGWIGDASYGWYSTKIVDGTHTTISYDSTTKYSGLQSLKVVSTNVADYTTQHLYSGYVNQDFESNIVYSIKRYFVPVKSSTTYKLSLRVKADNITAGAGSGLNIGYSLFTDSALITSANVITDYTGTMDWTYYSSTFTTGTTAKYINIGMTNQYLSGTYYIDDIRLEEVDTLSLSTQASGRPSVTITGVTDTNAIDQSQTSGPTTTYFGQTVVQQIAQSITPTQQKQTSTQIYLKKVGTPTDNLVITIEGETSDSPNGTVYASYTIASSSLTTTATPYTFNLPFISNLSKYTVKVARSGAVSDTDYYATLRDGDGTKYGNGAYSYYNGSSWVVLSDDLYFKTHFAKLSSSVDLNVVAPDGTSELKSYDVNGDILTDANITINPDGTGRYYYFVDPTQLNGFQTTDVWVNDIYQSSLGGGATYLGINGWTKTSLNGGKIYTANDAGATERYLTWKIKAPNNCNFSDINTMISSISLSGELGSRVLQYSFDNSTWVNTDINFNEYDGALTTKSDNFNIGGNNVVYLRFWKNNKGYLQFLNLTIDANMSCGSTTTPLFKNGTNTIYTMNKDATQQAGATLTPSLMSNLNFNYSTTTTTAMSYTIPNNNNQATITLTCTDTTYGCSNTYYYIDNNTTFNEYTTPIIFTSLGQHTITYYSTNGLGTPTPITTSSLEMPTLVTIKYPKNIQTLTQISEDWTLRSMGGVVVNLTDLNTDYNAYVLPNIPTTFYVIDANNNYTQNSYTKEYYDDSNTGYDTIQPYLYEILTSLATTINVQNTNTKKPIPDVTIKIYGNLPGLGNILIGQGITDSKGQILQLFIVGQNYVFEVYYKGVLLDTYNFVANKTETWIYYSFLDWDNNSLPPITVVTSDDFNSVSLDFFVIRNTLFNVCSDDDPCFPSALASIILTVIVILSSTILVHNSYIGVKGLSIVTFCCFTVFFGIGWLPIFIYAFLGTITLLMAVIVQ